MYRGIDGIAPLVFEKVVAIRGVCLICLRDGVKMRAGGGGRLSVVILSRTGRSR